MIIFIIIIIIVVVIIIIIIIIIIIYGVSLINYFIKMIMVTVVVGKKF